MDGLYYGEKGCSCCARGHSARGFSLGIKDAASLSFSKEVLQGFIRRVYGRKFNTTTDIDPALWREVLRIVNEGTIEGLAQSQYRPTHNDLFLQELRHGNEVFAAFKVHTMGEQMTARLYDADGQLKPFSKWLEEVSSISSHHVGAWLRTEYDTAVIRAHNAADWQQFLQDKDIMPNLRWMPTTSPQPESSHAFYWKSKLTLPVDDPFWEHHHPGDRWNCKCSLEQTNEPATAVPDDSPSDKPQRGLENNPGKDGHLFNQTHPYFPSKCSQCGFYRNSNITDRLKAVFLNRAKDCYHCPFINGCLERNEEKRSIDEAARARKEEVKELNLMPTSNDKNIPTLTTGTLHLSGKSRRRFLKHSHHDYDVDAAVYAWNNPQKLKEPRLCEWGEGKDLNDPEVQENLQRKRERHVSDYVEYRLDHNGKSFLVKLEKMTFGKEQFYAIMEE